MRKRLRFLYRYLFGRQRWRRWLHLQSVLVLVISAAFLATLFITAPMASDEQAARLRALRATGTAAAVTAQTAQAAYPAPASDDPPPGPTRTPLPPEYYTNADQTIGITIAATILTLIVVAGALLFMPENDV